MVNGTIGFDGPEPTGAINKILSLTEEELDKGEDR